MNHIRILIIEDDASVRTLLVHVLEEAGYHVYEAANGREGLHRFDREPVDLVLTDLEMPEINGLDVIRALTRVRVDVKIIAMSGLSSEERQVAKLLGARQTLSKPIDLQELLHTVQHESQHIGTGT